MLQRNYLLQQEVVKSYFLVEFLSLTTFIQVLTFSFYSSFPSFSPNFSKQPQLNTIFSKETKFWVKLDEKGRKNTLKKKNSTPKKVVIGRNSVKGSFLQHFCFKRQFDNIFFIMLFFATCSYKVVYSKFSLFQIMSILKNKKCARL